MKLQLEYYVFPFQVPFTRPPFEVQSQPPALDYNLTPSSAPDFADIYDGLNHYVGHQNSDEEKKRKLSKKRRSRKRKRPMRIGLDLYPMNHGQARSDDEDDEGSFVEGDSHLDDAGRSSDVDGHVGKQEVLLHLNVFSQTPKFRAGSR
jgi:hypothetical protein